MTKQLEDIHDLLDALAEMHDQADQDCPSEYRTSHFDQALDHSYDMVKELTQVYGDNSSK